MRLGVLAIGRVRGPCADLCAAYARRMDLWPLALREMEAKGAPSSPPALLQAREGEVLLHALPPEARVVVCDERGKNLSSAGFAALLGQWQDADGVRDTAFLLGGANGHTQTVRARADLLLSFGALTWPHALARVMLYEQLYRAQQIYRGHPYHRE